MRNLMQRVWKMDVRLQRQSKEILAIVEVVKESAALIGMAVETTVENEAVVVMIIAVEEN